MKLKVCTFNLRMDTRDDGINSFEGRKTFIRREFFKYGADIIGFQEVLPHMRDWLEDNLEGYTILGIGRNSDFTGESNVIAYRTDLFIPMMLDTFWLSDTPRVWGSVFHTDQSPCPRICTCSVLMERKSRKLIRLYNTHLDHEGAMAQVQGMTQILTRIKADDAIYPDTPVVLTGDFNATPDSAVHCQLTSFASCGKRLKDVTALVGGTYHGYSPEKELVKIDYIYTNADSNPSGSITLTDNEDGLYLSDHYPVLAEIEF